MDDEKAKLARRYLLKAEVDSSRLVDVAKLCGKPDRQINDMIEGRKAFGLKVAKQIEPLLRPDLPQGWLVFPSDDAVASALLEFPRALDNSAHAERKARSAKAPKKAELQSSGSSHVATFVDARTAQLSAIARTVSEEGWPTFITSVKALAGVYPKKRGKANAAR